MKTTLVRKHLSVLGAIVGLLACGSAAQAAAVNIAPLGTASQSSDLDAGVNSRASNANDGDTSGNWNASDVNHTKNVSGYSVGNGFEWWSVALDMDYLVERIDVWNRTDSGTARLSNFTLSLFNDGFVVWSGVYSSGDGPLPSTSFAVGFAGDTVRVQLNRMDFLHLAEVQVFGSNNIVVDPPGAVPEPGTYALLLAGFGALGFASRRRQR